MADSGRPIELLTEEDIAGINASLIRSFGGFLISNPNLRPDGPGLGFLLAAITYPLGEVDLFPTVIDKASYLAHYIITRHPFNDTNKRTAMEAAIELLELNGVVTYFQAAEIVETALRIESGVMDFESTRIWIAFNTVDWLGLS